jgi:D-glycero-alpha-D-manno-heptose 1-phosphate guanylyltransferase
MPALDKFRKSVTSAVILAGGLGTRLRSAVPDLPKPMAPISGRPFLEHQLDYWIAQGIEDFILSVGYKHDVITEHFGEQYRNTSLRYVIEPEPLGTGGGLLFAISQARPQNSPFLVLNGDTFFDVSLSDLSEFHFAQQSDWTFSMFRSKESDRYMSIQIAPNGEVLSLRSGAKGGLVNGGVYLVELDSLISCQFPLRNKLSLEDDLFTDMKSLGKQLFGFESQGRFIDIGIPTDYFRSAEFLQPIQSTKE